MIDTYCWHANQLIFTNNWILAFFKDDIAIVIGFDWLSVNLAILFV